MRRTENRKGAVSIQMLVLMSLVFFGLMGFAVDLGRLYLAKGELQTAAHAMAAAAAGKLIGTEQSTVDAADAARRMVEGNTGFANKYDFGANVIGQSTGTLNSEIADPTFYATVGEATGDGNASSSAAAAGEVGGSIARHVRIELTGETPLTFWRFLTIAQEGKVPIRVRAAGGISAPLCTVCGTEPIAIGALDASDTTNFGYITNTKYTFGYNCTGAPIPQPLAGSTQRIPYLILNRLNDQVSVFSSDDQQLFRVGAQGLIPSTTPALSCFTINAAEQIWATAIQSACSANSVQPPISYFVCGLATRMDNSAVQGCTNIAEVDTLTGLYQSDTDVTDLDDYTGYIGNARRILTVAIVDALSNTATMNVLGFRQFLLQPITGTAGIAPNDPNGRFTVSYLGSPMPIRQGSFGDCGVTSGPGKVVLHR